jgi:hypothetical protein
VRRRSCSSFLDDLHQEQDEDDEEDERDSASSVVAESWSHAITTEAEHKDQDDQDDKHSLFSPFGEDSPDGGVMLFSRFLRGEKNILFWSDLRSLDRIK